MTNATGLQPFVPTIHPFKKNTRFCSKNHYFQSVNQSSGNYEKTMDAFGCQLNFKLWRKQ